MAAVDYESYLSSRSLRREPSAIRALQPLLGEPGMISLGGGMPHCETFPFESVTVTLKDGLPGFTLEGGALDAALQYGATRGAPALVAHLEAVQSRAHGDRELVRGYFFQVFKGSS